MKSNGATRLPAPVMVEMARADKLTTRTYNVRRTMFRFVERRPSWDAIRRREQTENFWRAEIATDRRCRPGPVG